tara:strand:+ start:111 stop:437 length:327 start_codon:yes stop_codon:yes gene_type:complete
MTISLSVKVKDPIVASLIKKIEKRSNDGADEYGSDSILERIQDPLQLVSESLEEAIDQIIYLGCALSLLRDAQKELDKERQEDDALVKECVERYAGPIDPETGDPTRP